MIEAKLKVGFYQVAVFVLLAFIDLSDGGQIAMMSVTLPAVQKEFELGASSVSLLSSIFFIGTAIGSLSVGKFSDKYGRSRIIRIALVFQIVNALSFYFCKGFFALVILRFAYGFSYGFSLPLTTIYITEIVPLKVRGKWIVFINFFVTVGKLYGTIMAYYVMDNLEHGDWRLLMAYSAIIPLLIFLCSFVFLFESMRYLLANKLFDELKSTFNQIVAMNNSYVSDPEAPKSEEMSDEDIQKLSAWADQHLEDDALASYKVLFRDEWIKITILVWIIWFNLNFMFFGQLAILPYFFKSNSKGIGSVILTTSGELPVIFLTYFMIEHPNFGRKNSIFYFSLASMFFNLLSVIFDTSMLELLMFSTRFFMKGVFATVYPYTSEVYPTSFRSVGYGFAAAVGRTGACIMPFIIFPVYYWHESLTFWIFGLNGLLCAISAYQLPYDTAGRTLDKTKAFKEEIEMHEKPKNFETAEV